VTGAPSGVDGRCEGRGRLKGLDPAQDHARSPRGPSSVPPRLKEFVRREGRASSRSGRCGGMYCEKRRRVRTTSRRDGLVLRHVRGLR
jgi:hypothetical protein